MGIVNLVRRIVQWKSKIPLHFINGPKQFWQLFIICYICQHSPGLGIQIDFTAFTVLGTYISFSTQSSSIPVSIPCRLIDTAFHFFVLFFQELCICMITCIFHQIFQFPKCQTELMGKHHRFCLFIICNIQCVVPVCEKYFNQTVFTFICNQSVNGCFHMLQHCGFPTILPGCLFFQQCQITSFFDQFTYCPDDPEWLI